MKEMVRTLFVIIACLAYLGNCGSIKPTFMNKRQLIFQPIIFRWNIHANDNETFVSFFIEKMKNKKKVAEFMNGKDHMYAPYLRLYHQSDFISLEINHPNVDFDGGYNLHVQFRHKQTKELSNEIATFYLHIENEKIKLNGIPVIKHEPVGRRGRRKIEILETYSPILVIIIFIVISVWYWRRRIKKRINMQALDERLKANMN